MRYFFTILLLMIGLLYATEGSEKVKAPDFQLEDLEGNLVKLSDYNDKLIVLDFWATWCVPCLKELPHLNDLQIKYNEEIVVVCVNIDKARLISKAKSYLKSEGYEFVSVFDPDKKAQNLFNVTNPPRTVMIAPGMNIFWTHDGYQKGDEVHLDEAVARYIENKKNHTEESKDNTNFTVSGLNEVKYILKKTDNDDFHYYSNDLKLDLNYKSLRLGTKWELGNFPKDLLFIDDDLLEKEDFNSDFENILTERFLEYSSDKLYAKIGNFEGAFGSGIVFNAFNDTEIKDGDHSLDGVYSVLNFEKVKLSGFYGIAENFDDDNKLYGADVETSFLKNWKFGTSFVFQDLVINSLNDRADKNIFGGRIEYAQKLFDVKSEVAFNKYENVNKSLENNDYEGSAIYADASIYLGKLTFTTVYKNYENFNDDYNELPTAHFSDLALSEYGEGGVPGLDEEGLQGIIRFNLNEKNEFVVNYAEAWNNKKNEVSQSDFHSEWIHQFEGSSLALEFSRIERMDEETFYPKFRWDRETTPKISYDFKFLNIPMLVKSEFYTKELNLYGVEEWYYEPMIQYDLTIKNVAISTITTHKFSSADNLFEEDVKIGVETVKQIFGNTEAKLFLGSQKGGTICRNGVCVNQPAFEGVKIFLTTRF